MVLQKVAYLASEYPGISHTFILREIQALREQGLTVETASIRRPGALEKMPAAERQEAAQSLYIKCTPLLQVVAMHWLLLRTKPMAYLKTLHITWRIYRDGARNLIKAVGYLAEAGILLDWMHRKQLRHLHVHFANPAATVAMLAAAYGTVEYSLSIHGPDVFYNVDKNLLMQKISGARMVRCISHYCRSQVWRLVPSSLWERCQVVRCGIDPAVFSPRPDPGNTIAELLCLGRLVPAKGQHVLLQACGLLKQREIAFHLTLVGDGEDRLSLEAQVRQLGLEFEVEFAGAVGSDQVHGFYDRADLFVLASFAEGVPVVLMEAMAKEIAVVSTRITGIPELIEDGRDGVLVAPGDAVELADGLQRLIEKPALREELAAKGRKRVLNDYDLQKNNRALGDYFTTLEYAED